MAVASLSAPCEKFIALLRHSALLDADMLDRHLASRGRLPDDPARVAGLLVREGLLTRFQARLLLQGRPRRFFIGGKFKILDQLGQGGMGTVLLCEHLLMRRLVALKVLPAQKLSDPSLLERFFREARAAAALDHPNLVRAFDADRDGDLHYLVMEFVDGVSLQQLVADRGPMPHLRAAYCIAQAAAGLQAAHEAGWVHRDIKPGNILLDRAGAVKLLDLGLARLFADRADNLTKKFDDNATLGTADYLAPEQALDLASVDIRGDVYALGATFYFLLAGRAPFADKENIAQKLLAHQMLQPTPLRELRPDVPGRLAAIIGQMMAKKPSDRFAEPRDVIRALEPYARQPIAPPLPEEMPRWPKAIADLAVGSDPRLHGNPSASGVSTVSVRAQKTQTMAPPQRSAEPDRTAAGQKANVKPASPSKPRLTAALGKPRLKPKRKGRPLSPALIGVVLGTMFLIAIAAVAWAVWPTGAPHAVAAKEGRQAPVGSKLGPGTGRRSAASAVEPPPQPAMANLGRLDLARTVFVCRDRGSAPRGADRIAATLRDALAQAKPGETIAVLDERLQEALALEDGALGKRVTVIGARADGQPVLWQPPPGHERSPVLQIADLEGFALRGFQLDGDDDRVDGLISIRGRCPGLRLEELHLTQFKRVGIELRDAVGEADAPVTLQRVRFESGRKNQRLAALALAASGPNGENRHVLVTDCRFEGFFQAMIRVDGSLTFATARNNRFHILPYAASKSTKPHLPSDAFFIANAAKLRLTVANNTFLRFANGLRLEALPPRNPENRIVFRNNLILNMQACVLAGREGEEIEEAAALALFPNFEGNYCRPGTCTKGLAFLAPTVKEDIDRLSDSPEDDRSFLLYSKTSKLMTAGAGGEPVGAPPSAAK